MQSSVSLREAFRIALGSLRGSKLRSFLTLLGIILATTTLIAVMAVIHGMDVYIADQVSDMGSDGFRVRRLVVLGRVDPKTYIKMTRANPLLTPAEFEFLKANATLVREIGMEAFNSVTLRAGTESVKGVEMSGVSSNMGIITSTPVAAGRFFTISEDSRASEVVFIGNDIREKFFPGADPNGRMLNLDGRPFRVVGTAKKLGNVFGQSRDNFVMIPIQTYFKIYGRRSGLGYNALALDRNHINAAQDEVRMLIRAYRKLKPKDEDNFGMMGSDSLVQLWDQLTGVIAATAVAIVSVFMVVGGVVIMNIMLAVVTERTHEIGIRKAVGARRQDILNQFLVESSLLSACGGLIGVTVAWLITLVVRSATPIPMEMPLAAVFLGVGMSALVGLFFGVYPARQAARLDPIDALRFEK
ncbi:MAG: ABC transporter permease [Acidobacteria bacterium]|nr:ABC transporter permease [Acidobacteriota bacterium]